MELEGGAGVRRSEGKGEELGCDEVIYSVLSSQDI